MKDGKRCKTCCSSTTTTTTTTTTTGTTTYETLTECPVCADTFPYGVPRYILLEASDIGNCAHPPLPVSVKCDPLDPTICAYPGTFNDCPCPGWPPSLPGYYDGANLLNGSFILEGDCEQFGITYEYYGPTVYWYVSNLYEFTKVVYYGMVDITHTYNHNRTFFRMDTPNFCDFFGGSNQCCGYPSFSHEDVPEDARLCYEQCTEYDGCGLYPGCISCSGPVTGGSVGLHPLMS